jgi:hypothetical protein
MKRYLFVLLLCLAVPSVSAQTKTLLQRVQEATNNHSSTNKITVYYSPQYEKKALESRAGLEEATAYLDRKLKVKMDFTLAILDELQWNQIMETMQRRDAYTLEADKPSGLQPYRQPYGIPMSSAPPYIIFLPATPDNPPTKNALGAKPFLTESQIKEVEASGLSYEEAANKKPDLIGFHELGHQYVDVYGIRATNQWLREFLASYFAYAFLSEKHPKLANLYLALDEANLATIKPNHTSLEDLNNLGIAVGARNYGWYMGQLMRMVARVYRKKGLKFVAQVRKAFPMSEKESVSMEEGLHRLEKIHPGFIEWSKNLK